MRTEAISSHYDVIIIGAGIGGLTAGALLARAGKRTLLVEQAAHPGGYAASTHVRAEINGRTHTYLFDGAARSLMGCAPKSPFGPGVIYDFLDEMGDEERCEFIRLEPFCRVHLPDVTFDMLSGRPAFIEQYCHAFHADASKLDEIFDLSMKIYRAAMRLPGAGPLEQAWIGLSSPAVLRYMNATMQTGLAEFFPDPRQRAGLAALWGYLGAPPERASFLLWAGMMALYVEDGAYYCRGSLQHLSDVFTAAFLRQGGELLLNQSVTAIQSSSRRVEGVALSNGQKLRTKTVISSADPRDVFTRLLPQDQVPAGFRKQLAKWQPGPAAASLFLVTDLDLRQMGLPFESMWHSDWDMNLEVRSHSLAKPGGFSMTVPTIVDPGLAPAGQHMVSLTVSIPPGNELPLSQTERAQLAQALLDGAEKLIPGLRQHLLLPAPGYVLQEYASLNGWDATPAQSGLGRMAPRTPIRGLYQVGQYTQPGHGVLSVVMSGRVVSKLVLG